MSAVVVSVAAKWILLAYLFGVVVMFALIAMSEKHAEEEDKSTAFEILGYSMVWFVVLVVVVAEWAE